MVTVQSLDVFLRFVYVAKRIEKPFSDPSTQKAFTKKRLKMAAVFLSPFLMP